jgi:hypothetical protein
MSPFPHLQKQRSQTTHFNSTFLRPQLAQSNFVGSNALDLTWWRVNMCETAIWRRKMEEEEKHLCFGDEAHWAKTSQGMYLVFATETLALQQRKETRLLENQNHGWRVFSTFGFKIHL